MEILFLAIGLVAGLLIGFFLTAKAHRGILADDMDRITSIELFGWTVAQSNGRWAVLKDAAGQMKVIGSTQATLRQAIDAATQIERTASQSMAA